MNKLAHLLGNRGTASLAALGLLAACVSSVATLDPEIQAACIREAGITGSYSVTTTQFDDRITYVVGPGPGVRQAQTDIANACIARTIGGGQPGAPAMAAAAPKTVRPAPAIGASCEQGGSIFQGGSGYC
jgi:hypothetical protein